MITAALGLVTKLPFVTSALSWLSAKRSAVMHYGALLLLVIVAGFAIGAWYQAYELKLRLAQTETSVEIEKANNESLRSRLTTVENINENQTALIGNLQEQRVTDSITVVGLVKQVETLNKQDKSLNQKIDGLEKLSEKVKDFYRLPVPAEIDCVFTGACKVTPIKTGAGDTNSNGVSKAGATPNTNKPVSSTR